TVSDRVDAAVLTEKHRAIHMEVIGDDSQSLLAKHFPGADNGIESAEARVIQGDCRLWDSQRHQRLLHIGRLVVCLHMVVAAYQQVPHLAFAVKVGRSLDATGEVTIDVSMFRQATG